MPASFSPPPSVVMRRRSSLPPPLIGTPPSRRTSGRITPVMDPTYGNISPPGSSRSKTRPSDGKRIIDRPYFEDPEDDEDEEEDDVALRLDLSGAHPIPPENFIRPIPGRRLSRQEKPDKAFLERFSDTTPRSGSSPRSNSPEPSTASPRAGSGSDRGSERAPSPFKPRQKRKSRSGPSGAAAQAAAQAAMNRGNHKWSVVDSVSVVVLAIFVAAITVLLQHSW